MQTKTRALLGQLSDMDMRLLQIFKAVVDCGGFSAAELELNIDVSTISRHIRDLETRLGLTLCQRGRAGFMLTTEGRHVHEQTIKLLSAVDGFRAAIDDVHQRMGGQLNIALFEKTASNPASRVHHALSLFVERAPAVHLNLHVRPINEIERGVISDQYQIGIIPGHRSSQSLHYDYLFDEQMQLYCARNHPLFETDPELTDWDDIRAHALAGLGYHSPNMQMSHRTNLPRKASASDQEGVATLILSGKFIGFLPTHYTRQFESDGQIKALNPSRFFYDVKFFSIVRRSPMPARSTQLFQQCLMQAHAQQVNPTKSRNGRG